MDMDPNIDDATLNRGRSIYLLLMVTSLIALFLGMNATWSCDFAQRKVEYHDSYDLNDLCAEANFTGYNKAACDTFFNKPGIGFYHWQVSTIFDPVSYTHLTLPTIYSV